MTEVALKTLPLLPERMTLAVRNITADEAVGIFATVLATPFEVSGAAWRNGTAWLRIEGLGTAQLSYRRDRLLALMPGRMVEQMDAPASVALWRDLRDVTHFAGGAAPLWRLLVKASEAPRVVAALEEEPRINPATGTLEFALRDPDGYYVMVSALDRDAGRDR